MNAHKNAIFIEGGRRLAIIRDKAVAAVVAGATPLDIDTLCDQLITKGGDYPSFKTVADYHHATCINVNDVVVHGMPTADPFKAGDVVTVDVGLVHQGFHLDTSYTVQIPPHSKQVSRFLAAGQLSVTQAISVIVPGRTVFDISKAMQEVIEQEGFTVIRDLTGHGLGKTLHEYPSIPCYADLRSKKDVLKAGMVLAVEVMYTDGGHRLYQGEDGWTLRTVDGSLSAMFEESVLITETGHQILTRIS